MEGEPILKKTLYTMAVMVGVWIAFMGTVSLVVVLITTRVVGASQGEPSASPEVLQTMPPSKGTPSLQHLPPNSHAAPI